MDEGVLGACSEPVLQPAERGYGLDLIDPRDTRACSSTRSRAAHDEGAPAGAHARERALEIRGAPVLRVVDLATRRRRRSTAIVDAVTAGWVGCRRGSQRTRPCRGGSPPPDLGERVRAPGARRMAPVRPDRWPGSHEARRENDVSDGLGPPRSGRSGPTRHGHVRHRDDVAWCKTVRRRPRGHHHGPSTPPRSPGGARHGARGSSCGLPRRRSRPDSVRTPRGAAGPVLVTTLATSTTSNRRGRWGRIHTATEEELGPGVCGLPRAAALPAEIETHAASRGIASLDPTP